MQISIFFIIVIFLNIHFHHNIFFIQNSQVFLLIFVQTIILFQDLSVPLKKFLLSNSLKASSPAWYKS